MYNEHSVGLGYSCVYVEIQIYTCIVYCAKSDLIFDMHKHKLTAYVLHWYAGHRYTYAIQMRIILQWVQLTRNSRAGEVDVYEWS